MSDYQLILRRWFETTLWSKQLNHVLFQPFPAMPENISVSLEIQLHKLSNSGTIFPHNTPCCIQAIAPLE
jgi:hypothetical protein